MFEYLSKIDLLNFLNAFIMTKHATQPTQEAADCSDVAVASVDTTYSPPLFESEPIQLPAEIIGESKQTRISAKRRKEDLDNLKSTFLLSSKIQDRHIVAIEDETWQQLDMVVRRIGDRGSNVGSYITAILNHHLKEYQPQIDVWRKL